MENTKQKLADAGRAAKDYGTVGQQRAGEYLQQAVDQVIYPSEERVLWHMHYFCPQYSDSAC